MMYSSWETDKIIAFELVRNLSLALVAVFVMTLILIANIVSSIYVLLCVLLTLVSKRKIFLVVNFFPFCKDYHFPLCYY